MAAIPKTCCEFSPAKQTVLIFPKKPLGIIAAFPIKCELKRRQIIRKIVAGWGLFGIYCFQFILNKCQVA